MEIYPTNEPAFETTSKPEDPKQTSPVYNIEPELAESRQPEMLEHLGGELRMPGGGLLPPSGLRMPGGGLQPPSGLRMPGGGLLPPSGNTQAFGGTLGGGLFPGPVFPGASEVRPIELEYSIKVDKIFKTNPDVTLDPKTTAKIYTAPFDGMCGVDSLVNGETYLLTGMHLYYLNIF